MWMDIKNHYMNVACRLVHEIYALLVSFLSVTNSVF